MSRKGLKELYEEFRGLEKTTHSLHVPTYHPLINDKLKRYPTLKRYIHGPAISVNKSMTRARHAKGKTWQPRNSWLIYY